MTKKIKAAIINEGGFPVAFDLPVDLETATNMLMGKYESFLKKSGLDETKEMPLTKSHLTKSSGIIYVYEGLGDDIMNPSSPFKPHLSIEYILNNREKEYVYWVHPYIPDEYLIKQSEEFHKYLLGL